MLLASADLLQAHARVGPHTRQLLAHNAAGRCEVSTHMPGHPSDGWRPGTSEAAGLACMAMCAAPARVAKRASAQMVPLISFAACTPPGVGER